VSIDGAAYVPIINIENDGVFSSYHRLLRLRALARNCRSRLSNID